MTQSEMEKYLSDRSIVQVGFFVCGFQFEDDRAQTVIAAAYRYTRLAYPVTEIEQSFTGSMGQSKHILVNSFPGFVAETVRLTAKTAENALSRAEKCQTNRKKRRKCC